MAKSNTAVLRQDINVENISGEILQANLIYVNSR